MEENEESDRRAAQILGKLCPDRELSRYDTRDILTGRKYPLYYADSGRERDEIIRTEAVRRAAETNLEKDKSTGVTGGKRTWEKDR